MPSRFCFYGEPEAVVDRFPVEKIGIEYYKNYNIKPTNRVVGIVHNQENNENEVVRLRWGFVKGNKFFKARGETIHEKRLFGKAFKERRCLILANGFFEWKKIEGNSVPYYFKLKNDDMFAVAGVYNKYIDEDDDNKIKYQFAVITADANNLVREIFHRMPVMFSKDDEHMWLDSKSSEDELLAMMKSYPEDLMESYQVNELPARRDKGPDTIKPTGKISTLDDFF